MTESQPPSRRKGPRALKLGVLLVLVLGGLWLGRNYMAEATVDASNATRQAAHGADAEGVPVTLAEAGKGSFPIYLDGLGTVQALNTVTVRSLVDGQIQRIGFKEGQIVNKGDILVEIDPRPYQAALAEAQAKLAQDQANLKNAQTDLARYSALSQQEFASRQQLDTQRATVSQLTAGIQGDQAAISNAQTQLGYATIRAPLTGRAGFLLVDEGNIVHAADANGIVTIQQIQPITVVFSAPQEEIPAISKALAAGDAPVLALGPDGKTVLSRGTLSFANNEVDVASGTIRLKATFANDDNALWPGQSVSTRLLLDTLRDVTLVPENAVQHGPSGLYAYVAGSDGKAQMRPIKVARSGDGQAVIAEGLAPGDKAVVEGAYRVQPGVALKVNAMDKPAAPGQPGEAQKAPMQD